MPDRMLPASTEPVLDAVCKVVFYKPTTSVLCKKTCILHNACRCVTSSSRQRRVRAGLTIALLGLSDVTALCTEATALDQVLLIPCAWSCVSICNKMLDLGHNEQVGRYFSIYQTLPGSRANDHGYQQGRTWTSSLLARMVALLLTHNEAASTVARATVANFIFSDCEVVLR